MSESVLRSESDELVDRLSAPGNRLVGLFGTADGDGTLVTAVVAERDQVVLLDQHVLDTYPSLTGVAPGAFWYERAMHDHFGVVATGHPRLDPLVLAGMHTTTGVAVAPPRPGSGDRTPTLLPSEEAIPRHLRGPGLFTIPHGPVRSGVTESLEFLVETPGEDIPRLQIRVFAKHRGVEVAFEERDPSDGVVLAERVEGVASVAHGLAYCQALETLSGVDVPDPAAWVRLLHAELERIAGHLEVAYRLCEAAALAVGVARFSQYKEELLRIRHHLCGSRYGRGVVMLGGVTPQDAACFTDHQRRTSLRRLRDRVRRQRDLLMVTSSFLDRLRGTGPLLTHVASTMGAVGPVGRASGATHDVRWNHPYGAYRAVDPPPLPPASTVGDVQARLDVRWHEIDIAFELADQALARLAELPPQPAWAVPVPSTDGRSIGVVEGPQGETAYVVDVADGHLRRVWPRTPSFHNLMLFHDVFHGDVLTDFPFIEASFAVSNAGVVM